MNREIVLGEVEVEIEVIGIRYPRLGPALFVARFGGQHCCQRLELEDFGSKVDEGRLSHWVRFSRAFKFGALYTSELRLISGPGLNSLLGYNKWAK